ncbi:ribosomal protection-like ABC-F family protein [Allonocardiopsis opalescens]|uniref:Macrolide transport system ATP-binding/permease protein n=1 Tax=Allonocardiopsis opalescens TaxID=1144618 RepID=A0A2T0PX70_9ACTN|nr:ABC-F type ribosomal protection protein [Allonocardiopsis opalescens]PRX96140.1 macrolide transport system ATP-binding/permease protein [Allonocardiopsis opalescens]
MAPTPAGRPSGRTQLALTEVTKRYGDRTVLERVSFTVKPGEKVGVIGDNGSGKSTLLRLLAGVEEPDNGELTVTAPGGTAYLPQRLDLAPGATVADVIDDALAELRGIEARLRAAEAGLGEAGPAGLAAYGELQAEFEAREGYRADARVDAALDHLGLPGLDRARRADTLSGGERSRLALAAALAAAPELMLLDEPTNDLDDDAVAWLEERLGAHRGTVVVITHDRLFLEKVTSAILEVDPDTRTVNRYGDGYAGYLGAKAAARARWERSYRAWLDEIARQTELAATARGMLASISRKGPAAFSGAGAHRSRSSSYATSGRVRNANERLRRLRENPVPRPPDPLRFTAELTTASSGAEDTVLTELAGVVVEGRLRVPELRIEPGQRLLVTGPNGAGKSTLLKVLAGEIRPDAGSVVRAERVGHLRQDEGTAHPGRSVLAAFAAGREGHADEYADQLLALGLFRPEELRLPVGALSVGQRRRIELARMVVEPADILLLDEPTNHLSPLLVEQLERALAEYAGAVVVVTHDRRMRRAFSGTRLELRSGEVAAVSGGAPG